MPVSVVKVPGPTAKATAPCSLAATARRQVNWIRAALELAYAEAWGASLHAPYAAQDTYDLLLLP
jgi:hypothetical protein